MTAANHDQYRDFYGTDDPNRLGRQHMPLQEEITRSWMRTAGIKVEAVVLELGCGMGAFSAIHPGYRGLDFSLPALRRFPRPASRVHGDMQHLPVRSGSVDFAFSWAALEHVPMPELVLDEILRIMSPGGVAMLAPAWNVRPWAAKALPIRAYRDLRLADGLRKASIPMRESLPWRAAAAAPPRLFRELCLLLGRRLPFGYRRLTPNMTTYDYTDGDAFTSMDPHAVLAFFVSRGWESLSHRGIAQRLNVRGEAVVIRRPLL